MKLEHFFCILVFAALVGITSTTNVTWGNIGPYDLLLHYDIIKKSSSFMQVATIDVTYPTGHQYNNRTITAIRVTDQIANDKGGYAQLYSGGVGFNHVTVHFKSQRGKSFNFIFEVFGAR